MRLTATLDCPGFIPWGPRAAQLMRRFGLDRQDLPEQSPSIPISVELTAGQICLLTGPSGSGKTLLLRQFFQQADAESRIWLEEIVLESERSVIDCVQEPLDEALRLLTQAGLADVFALLRPPAHLSTGQQYRYRLLQALRSGRLVIFADEFGSCLDFAGAAVLALQTARLIRQRRLILLAAATREDSACFLEPDILIRFDAPACAEVLAVRAPEHPGPKGMPPADLPVSQAAIRRRGLKSVSR
ncbi:MAG: ATP-binding cassette domain-containing protein [Anaerohalosphaeraceae bacterium]